MPNRRAPHTLVTARLRGERFTATHVAELGRLDADPAVQARIFGTTFTPEQTRERAAKRDAHWREHGFGDYVVRLPDGAFAGSVGLFFSPLIAGEIHLGYALLPPFWGHGYATELAYGALRIAFEILVLPVVIATVLPDHAASRRVLEKTGFTFCGSDRADPEVVRYHIAREAWPPAR